MNCPEPNFADMNLVDRMLQASESECPPEKILHLSGTVRDGQVTLPQDQFVALLETLQQTDHINRLATYQIEVLVEERQYLEMAYLDMRRSRNVARWVLLASIGIIISGVVLRG